MRCFVRYLLLAVTVLITCFIPFNFASGHDSVEDQPPAATAAENSAELKDLATRAVYYVHCDGAPVGLSDGGRFSLLGSQLIVVLISYIFTIVVTLILLKLLDNTKRLRVTQEGEIVGLDLSQHGEEGYITL